MKQYLVTGGAGFIGSNFIHYLLAKYGSEVRIVNVDKLTYAGNLDNLKDVANAPNYRFVHGDICDARLMDELVPAADVVVNFAAESHVDRSIGAP
ncbi:MAG TPA: GDP-mannose 4,6-dehydratase, partial [bacterium]|nr:GDP-mannose 4,6-dehydratase [bacterium]